MKLTKTAGVVAAAATLLLLAGCGTTQNQAGTGSSDDKLTIGVSFDLVNDIRSAELASIKDAAKKQGDTVEFVSADQDAQKQASQIQDLVQTKKVDALIVIAANNDQIASSIALANSAKVPFIAIDRAVSGGDVTFQVTGDPVADGKLAAKEALAVAGDNPTIIQLVGALTDQNAIGRRDGFTDGVKAAGKTVAAEVPTDWDPSKALDGTSNALQANPKVNTIFIPSDYLLPSVQSALQAAGKLKPVGDPGHITIVTIDGDPNGCKAIKDKTIDSDIVTPVDSFGEQAVAAAHTAHGGKSVSPAEAQVAGFALNQANASTTLSKTWGCNTK